MLRRISFPQTSILLFHSALEAWIIRISQARSTNSTRVLSTRWMDGWYPIWYPMPGVPCLTGVSYCIPYPFYSLVDRQRTRAGVKKNCITTLISPDVDMCLTNVEIEFVISIDITAAIADASMNRYILLSNMGWWLHVVYQCAFTSTAVCLLMALRTDRSWDEGRHKSVRFVVFSYVCLAPWNHVWILGGNRGLHTC